MSNKASNILEDLETLRLLSKVLPEYVLPPMDEESISQVAFELLFAFDEVISLGYKENVTVGQVKQNTEMESHEEKLHKMIIASKVSDTKVSTSAALSISTTKNQHPHLSLYPQHYQKRDRKEQIICLYGPLGGQSIILLVMDKMLKR